MTLISDLQGMLKSGEFNPFITKMVFPQFKNLVQDSEINFDFPITALVGQNGSGKSSCLYAIHGAPDGVSVQKHWFTTSMDPIPEEISGRRPSFAYNYRDMSGTHHKEVLYTRSYRPKDPDYWETSRPLKKYGLTSPVRAKPVDMDVIYIDFRAILSSFDKYMHFLWQSHNIVSSKNNFLRQAAQKMSKVFGGIQEYKQAKFKDVDSLSNLELACVNRILAKNYLSCTILEHRLHREPGQTIKFELPNSNSYSDAFAGSGEISIVHIVTSVMRANNASLIILDEPEVSLHPGAQKELLNFLLQQTKEKRHQVILSTHSPFLIEGLPSSAIKVFRNNNAGKFEIAENVSPEQAFVRIGHNNFTKKTIIVEDALAKKIIGKVIVREGKQGVCEVKYGPGGHSGIRSLIVDTNRYSMGLNNLFIVFDGDQNPQSDIPALTTLSEDEIRDLYKEIIQHKNLSNDASYTELDQIKDLLKYFKSDGVFYLPTAEWPPEKILWSEHVAKAYLNDQTDKSLGEIDALVKQLSILAADKKKIKEVYCKIAGYVDIDCTSDTIFDVEKHFLDVWISKKNSDYALIKTWLDKIL